MVFSLVSEEHARPGAIIGATLTHPRMWVVAYLHTACRRGGGEGGCRSAGGVRRDREGIAVGDEEKMLKAISSVV